MAAKKTIRRKKYTNYLDVYIGRHHAQQNRKWGKRKKKSIERGV